tara:strand:- start:998 stop:1102 length:105 start_codon:yes stop_codon:yes gene_type:complete
MLGASGIQFCFLVLSRVALKMLRAIVFAIAFPDY